MPVVCMHSRCFARCSARCSAHSTLFLHLLTSAFKLAAVSSPLAGASEAWRGGDIWRTRAAQVRAPLREHTGDL